MNTHIRELYEIRSTGAATPETAYYPALSNLLNEVGKNLKPRVVTNYRDFVLVGQDASGQAAKLEIYLLADSEADFGAGALGAPMLFSFMSSPAWPQAENRFENFGGTFCRGGHLQAGGVIRTKTD
jgi:hypothetical protein